MSLFFFFNDTATTEIYTLSLHDALPIFAQAAAELFPGEQGPLFLGGHPMAGRELPGIAHADADLFRENAYALIAESTEAVVAGVKAGSSSVEEPEATHGPRISAFVRILEKIGARALWLVAPQHDY